MFIQTKYDIGDVLVTKEGVHTEVNGIQVTNMDGRVVVYYFLNDEIFLETEISHKADNNDKQL